MTRASAEAHHHEVPVRWHPEDAAPERGRRWAWSEDGATGQGGGQAQSQEGPLCVPTAVASPWTCAMRT